MPPSSRNQHLAAARAKGKSIQADKQAALASETATDDLWNSLQAANSHIEELEQQLAQKNAECHRLQSELDKSNQKLQNYKDSSAFWKEKQEKTYHELCMQHQTTKQGKEKLTRVEKQIEILKIAEKEASKEFLRGSRESYQAIASLKKENETLHKELSVSMARWTSQLEKTYAKLAMSTSNLKILWEKASKLVMCKARLGPKAAALARPDTARALQKSGPSQSRQGGPGSGSAWLRPQLLAEKYIIDLFHTKKINFGIR